MTGASPNTFVGACSEGFDIEFFIKTDGTDDLITMLGGVCMLVRVF